MCKKCIVCSKSINDDLNEGCCEKCGHSFHLNSCGYYKSNYTQICHTCETGKKNKAIINLYFGDSEIAIKDMPAKSYDLAFPDPPYGIGATKMNMGTHTTRKGDGYPGESTATKIRKNRLNSGSGKLKNRILNTSNCEWDEIPPPPEYFENLLRISKRQIIWGGNYFAHMLPASRGWIEWDKMQPWENFSQFELAWTSFDMPAKKFTYSNTGGANAETKIHPTQKPVALYKWQLEKFAKPGWKLLDTHGGSMSSVIACIDAGYDIDCWEKDRQHFDSGVRRVKQHAAQLDLFREPPVINIYIDGININDNRG